MDSYIQFLQKYTKKGAKEYFLFQEEDKKKYTLLSLSSLEGISKFMRLPETKSKDKSNNQSYSFISFPIEKCRKYIDILNINDYTIHIVNDIKESEIEKTYYARSLIEIYFDYQQEFEKKYGEKTLVLMQVGGFFEFYGVDNDVEKIGNSRIVADLMNITLSRRDKNVLENNRKNALMAGFPIANLRKYVPVMIQNGYTVIVIEHVSSAPDPLREVTHIYSPATYIEDIYGIHDGNMFVSIFMSESKGGVYSCGMSAIDVSTGSSYVYHIQDINSDKRALFEDIYRFVENFHPKELLFTSHHLTSISKEYIQNILSGGGGASERIIHNYYNLMDSNDTYLKVHYLNSVLEKIYKNHGILSGIEYIHLEKYYDSVVSFVSGIQWVYDHDPNIIEKMKVPQIYDYHKHLILYHNAAYQLNLIHLHKDGSQSGNHSKYKSLFDIIQKTSTPMGKRKLKFDLLNPITNIDQLNASYDRIEKMSDYKSVENQLSTILDMERYHRKMNLKMLHPQDFSSLYYTYQNILELFKYVDCDDYGLSEDQIAQFKSYLDFIEKHVDVREMGKYNLNDISNSFFQSNTYTDLDEVQKKIYETEALMNKECALLNIEIRKKDNSSCESVIKVEENNDGYFMSTTKRRSEMLSKEVASKYTITKGVGNNVRITSDAFTQNSELLVSYREKIKSIVKEKYIQFLDLLVTQYSEIMEKIVQFVALVDVIKSHKKCAIMYGYQRPRISNREESKSFLDAKGIRHPIIEIIEDTKAYIANDVYIGNKCTGFLLYGVNGVGKSSLSKAIGINIIMAQMGMYVPSREFTYYPFTKIFTRINGDDNIFKGMSSFVVEMNELRSILKYSDHRSIVLGDEVCKGTEETSALSIVASAIQRFSEKNVNFILATHFHKLYDLLMKRNLQNISFKHLSIEIDTKSNAILYGRKLMDGMGSTNYGLDIARFILEDEAFMMNAKSVRDEILEIERMILTPQTSNYHKNVFLHECAICGKSGITSQLDTHHIVEQHEFQKDDFFKDASHNLVVLCKNHHNEVHHGKLRIYGYKDGPQGRILDYTYLLEGEGEEESKSKSESQSDQSEEELETLSEISEVSSITTNSKNKSKKKYDDQVVKRVLQLAKEFEEQLNQVKIIQSTINKESQMIIPIATIKKMISGSY